MMRLLFSFAAVLLHQTPSQAAYVKPSLDPMPSRGFLLAKLVVERDKSRDLPTRLGFYTSRVAQNARKLAFLAEQEEKKKATQKAPKQSVKP